MTAVGFPWAQDRPDRTRDTEQLFGFLPPPSGTAGVQAITVLTAAPRERPPAGRRGRGCPAPACSPARSWSASSSSTRRSSAPTGCTPPRSPPSWTILSWPGCSTLARCSRCGSRFRLAVTAEPTVGLPPPYQPLDDATRAPARLLLPDRGIVPFTGRGSQLRVAAVEPTGGRLALRVLTGAGGAGKTRLAAELCARLAGDGFDVGFADPDAPGGQPLSTTTGPP